MNPDYKQRRMEKINKLYLESDPEAIKKFLAASVYCKSGLVLTECFLLFEECLLNKLTTEMKYRIKEEIEHEQKRTANVPTTSESGGSN